MKRALLIAFAAVASGALLCLALPPAGYWFVGWFALSPLLAAIRDTRFITGFVGGLVCVFTAAFLARSGVLYETKAWIGTDAWIFTGFGLFGFSVSVFAGMWADKGTAGKPFWWFAALATALESVLLLELPAHLALTQSTHAGLLKLTSFGGIWLATFLVWWVNLGFVWFLKNRSIRTATYFAALSIVILISGFGWPVIMTTMTPGRQIAVVQTESSDREALMKLQQQAMRKQVQIVVWPEFAGLGLAPGGDTRELVEMAKESGGAIVTTYNDDYRPLPHNVASLIGPEGAQGRYYKQKLFGGETKMHTPGSEPMAVTYRQYVVGLNICFDSCFPAVIRETANLEDVDLIVLPTIDPPSPHHFVAAIHAAFTPFRAAENGITIARADGYAYSQIVFPNGQTLFSLAAGEAVGNGWVWSRTPTLYSRFGDWFLYLCYGLVVFGVFKYRKPRKAKPPTEEERLEAFAEKTLAEVGS